jgi:hypothetical protein
MLVARESHQRVSEGLLVLLTERFEQPSTARVDAVDAVDAAQRATTRMLLVAADVDAYVDGLRDQQAGRWIDNLLNELADAVEHRRGVVRDRRHSTGTAHVPGFEQLERGAISNFANEDAVWSVSHGIRHRAPSRSAGGIGIVLGSDKNDAMIKITLPEDNEQILAARYQMYYPPNSKRRARVAPALLCVLTSMPPRRRIGLGCLLCRSKAFSLRAVVGCLHSGVL